MPTSITMAGPDACEILRGHLQRLPQELYDEIYERVFTASGVVRNMTNDDGVDTKLLQINSASRALYAQSYFGQGAEFIFAFDNDDHVCSLAKLSWTRVLPAEHFNLIENISIIVEAGADHGLGWFKQVMTNDSKLRNNLSKFTFYYVCNPDIVWDRQPFLDV